MSKKHLAAALALGAAWIGPDAWADNPIVQTSYTADPAAMVWKDTFYVFTGHDEDVLVNNFFTMNEWRCYSSTDMVNWTDRGAPLNYKSFAWSGGKAWAAQVVERDGKFYWYVTAGLTGSNQPAIGVAVADHPLGPYKDPIGKPLIKNSWDDIDPTAFVDSDGQAYLYWGNPKLYYVKLNKDMASYTGGIQTIPMTTASFAPRPGDAVAGRPTSYEEAPWFYKRGGQYYMVYATGPLPEKIAYSTSPGPLGPWTYRGQIMSADGTNSFTNHPAIVDFKGRSYFVYHTGKLPGGGGFNRSVAVESFSYNADGTIPTIRMGSGPSPVDSLDPYGRVEGETMAFSSGIKVGAHGGNGIHVTGIDNGDFLKVRSVDFGRDGAKSFAATVASAGAGGTIELRLGSQTGTLVGTLAVPGTGGSTTWKTVSTTVTGARGVQDLFLVFRGSGTGGLFNLDWWQFAASTVGVERSLSPAGLASDRIDVFSVSGERVRTGVLRAQATRGLGKGLYIVDGRPVAVFETH